MKISTPDGFHPELDREVMKADILRAHPWITDDDTVEVRGITDDDRVRAWVNRDASCPSSQRAAHSKAVPVTMEPSWRCAVCGAKPNPFCLRMAILSSGKPVNDFLDSLHKEAIAASAAAGEEGYIDLFDPPGPSASIAS